MESSPENIRPGIIRSSFPKRYQASWMKIIMTGATDDMADRERERTELVNLASFLEILGYISLLITYSGSGQAIIFWGCLLGALLSLIPFILNYYHQRLAACHFFVIYNLLAYSFLSISSGGRIESQYFLIANSIAAMLFFRKFRTVFIYAVLNLLFFGLCTYSSAILKPVLPAPLEHPLGYPFYIVIFIFLFLIVFYFKSENVIQEGLLEEKNKNLMLEKQKSDRLLLNILPPGIADELTQTGKVKTKSFRLVTVMFMDFKGFTSITQKIPPETLVSEINQYFSFFDEIVGRYNIEKIKTIGDAYMCCGGMPVENNTHPVDMIHAAFDILNYVESQKRKNIRDGEPYFELRIGIHTGPVIAGMIGIRKFAYDIWGNTVNIASHMQSSGQAGKINISEDTFNLVKEKIQCAYHDKILLKNKKELAMYYASNKI